MVSAAKRYIDSLSAKGQIAFTSAQIATDMVITKKAASRALERLKKAQEIVSVAKGYYLILSPEFRSLGCLPADYFIDSLMSHLGVHYHIGLLSAAMLYGAAHHQPQICQVIVAKERPAIKCGNVHVEFIQSAASERIPVKAFKTTTGMMQVSTPEATAMELVMFLRRSGGIGRVATVLSELAECMQPDALIALTKLYKGPIWVQRLGFLLEKLGYNNLSDALYHHLGTVKTRIVPLVPYASVRGSERDKKWRVAINTIVESDI